MSAIVNSNAAATPDAGMKRKHKTLFSSERAALYAVLIGATLFFAIPLLIILMTSVKSMDDIRAGSIFSLPPAITFAPWLKAWAHACTGLACEGVRPGFLNSFKIVLPSMLLSVLLGAFNGYVLAFWRFRGSGAILVMLMLCIFIPYQVILYPLVKIFSALGLYGTLAGIITLHVVLGMPTMTLIFRNFYSGIPIELFKAARVDGAGLIRIFFSIMLPLSTNILIVAVILQFTHIWNDYLLGLIFAGRDNWPMTVQLNVLVNASMGEQEYNVNMAATLLTALPTLLVYFLSGRYFVKGITAGAVKG